MNLKWSYVISGLLICVHALPEGQIEVFIEITGLEYEELCSNVSQSKWAFIKEPSNQTLQLWENSLKQYGLLKRQEKNAIDAKNVNGTNFHGIENSQLEYKYNLVSKPGDALLESKEWEQFVNFVGEAELLQLTGNYSLGKNYLYREDAGKLLARRGTPEDKLETWTEWHKTLKPLTTKFSHNLQLVQKAAKANDANNVTEYWEMLSEYENGYKEAKDKWNEISALYEKVVNFVQSRLSRKYKNFVESGVLPAHLLGSLQGHDWTHLAIDVIPDYNMIFEMRKNLGSLELVGRNLYKAASRLGNVTLKHVPEAQFFEDSNFLGQCLPQLINQCRGRMRLYSCSDSSLSNYLSAHKNIAKVLIHQMSEQSNPILNVANRYSALEEGVSELFGIFAASQAWLLSLGLVNETDDIDQAQIDSLMITALDVLPRMAYYLMADMWRLEGIASNSQPDSLTELWWKYRLQYEGITSNSVDLPTFLDDNFIINNQPYLSKFFGTILGFQIYSYLMESAEVRTKTIEMTSIHHEYKSQLIRMIQNGTTENWRKAIQDYLSIEEISTDSLLSYFAPLEQYIKDIEDEDFISIPSELEKTLEKLEDEYKIKFENPSTTTTRTTTTTTTTTTKTTTKMTVPSTTVIKSAKSQMVETSPSPKVQVDITNIPRRDTALDMMEESEEGTKIIKSDTSKAVWAVAAVIIATIFIVVISIFGRRRCKKTPKNRRYV